jgi:hypothetical protein
LNKSDGYYSNLAMCDRRCECWPALAELWPDCIAAIVQEYVHLIHDDPLRALKIISPRVDQSASGFQLNDYILQTRDAFDRRRERPCLSYAIHPDVTIELDLDPIISESKHELRVTLRVSHSLTVSFEVACDFNTPWEAHDLFLPDRIDRIWREPAAEHIKMPLEFILGCMNMADYIKRAISYSLHHFVPERRYVDA